VAHLYADEGFPFVVTSLLVELGHDVLTVQAAVGVSLPLSA
jgi:hypothetical protein